MATRAVDIDAEVIGIDGNVCLFRLGQDCYCGGAGVDAPLALGNGHALHAVHTTLKLELGIRCITRNLEDDFFVPTRVVGGLAKQLGAVTMRLTPAQIHAVELGRKERGFVTTRASPNLHDDILLVIGVFGGEEDEELVVELGNGGFVFGDLELGELGKLVIALSELTRLSQLLLHGSTLGSGSNDGFEFRKALILGGKIGCTIRIRLSKKLLQRSALSRQGGDIERNFGHILMIIPRG